MDCPVCGYAMAATDLDCPRCDRMRMRSVSSPSKVPAPARGLSREVHPAWFLLIVSILLPIVGLIVGIVYLCKSDERSRIGGMVAIVASVLTASIFLLRYL